MNAFKCLKNFDKKLVFKKSSEARNSFPIQNGDPIDCLLQNEFFFLRSWQSSLNEWQRSQKYQNLKFQLFLKPFFRVLLHIWNLFWWVKKANFCFKKVKYKINICCKMRHFQTLCIWQRCINIRGRRRGHLDVHFLLHI